MKLVIITAIWKRPKVFNYFKTFYNRIRTDFKNEMNVECVVVGSEGKVSERQCDRKGMYYVEFDNQPLCHKWNAVSMACKELDPDYILCMGSDDIFCNRLMTEYLTLMKQSIDYICISDSYFFDVRNKFAIYWAGYIEAYNKGVSAGIGRCISKRLADGWGWKFWETGFDLVVDEGMERKLKSIGHSKRMISCREKNSLALDIKSKENMTPLEQWPNSRKAGKDILYNYLPKSEADKIYNYE